MDRRVAARTGTAGSEAIAQVSKRRARLEKAGADGNG